MPTFPTPRSAYFGEPATPGHEPDKADLVRLFEQTQAIATTGVLTGFVGALADLPASGNTTGDTYAAMVAGDDGGVYEWSGSAWVKISSLPVALTTDEFALLAKAWAQSPTAPDPDDATSQSAKTWAELAQQVADGTAVTVFDSADLPAVTTSDNDLFGQVVTTVGKQAWKVVSGAWAFQFWIDGPEYETVADAIASPLEFADGTIIRTREEGFAYRVDSTATVGFIENSATTAVKLVALPDSQGRISLEQLGVVVETLAETGADNTAVLATISTRFADFAGVLTCGPGFVRTKGPFKIPKNASLICDNTVFDADGDTTGTYADGGVVVKKGDTPVAIPDLASDVEKGHRSLAFATAHGLSKGDVVLIFNPTDSSFSGFRVDYRAGEYCTVFEVVSTTEIKTEAPLYSDYTATSVDVYECSGYGTGRIEGVSSIAPGAGANGVVRGVDVEFCHKVDLSNVVGSNSDNTSGAITACYKVTGHNLDFTQTTQDPGFGTQYGFAIVNVQQADISGRFNGYRHGVVKTTGAQGFATPNRSVRVHDFIAKSNTDGISAADWHGNCEWCVYENGQTLGAGGFNLSGNHNRISNVEAICSGAGAVPILGRELLGCDHIVESFTCFTQGNDTSRGVIDIGGNDTNTFTAKTVLGGRFVFRDISIKAPNQTASQAIWVRNRGAASIDYDVIVQKISYDAPGSGAGSAVLRVQTDSGVQPRRLECTGVEMSGSVDTPISLSGGAGSALIRQDPCAGSVEWTTDTSSNVKDVAVSFPQPFAKDPAVVITSNDHTAGGSGEKLIAYASSITGAGFDASLFRTDNANFSNAIARDGSWIAMLKEW